MAMSGSFQAIGDLMEGLTESGRKRYYRVDS